MVVLPDPDSPTSVVMRPAGICSDHVAQHRPAAVGKADIAQLAADFEGRRACALEPLARLLDVRHRVEQRPIGRVRLRKLGEGAAHARDRAHELERDQAGHNHLVDRRSEHACRQKGAGRQQIRLDQIRQAERHRLRHHQAVDGLAQALGVLDQLADEAGVPVHRLQRLEPGEHVVQLHHQPAHGALPLAAGEVRRAGQGAQREAHQHAHADRDQRHLPAHEQREATEDRGAHRLIDHLQGVAEGGRRPIGLGGCGGHEAANRLDREIRPLGVDQGLQQPPPDILADGGAGPAQRPRHDHADHRLEPDRRRDQQAKDLEVGRQVEEGQGPLDHFVEGCRIPAAPWSRWRGSGTPTATPTPSRKPVTIMARISGT